MVPAAAVAGQEADLAAAVAVAVPAEGEGGPGDVLRPGEEFAPSASSTFGISIIKMWTGFAASYLTGPRWSPAGGPAYAPNISVD